MADITNIISSEFKDLLGIHMKAYHGAIIPEIFDGNYEQVSDNVYHLSVTVDIEPESEPDVEAEPDTEPDAGIKVGFLNTGGIINAYIFKEGDKAIFCMVPEIEVRPFSGYFPQMVPQTPWLSEQESNLPFPNLPAIKVDKIQWLYVYSTEGLAATTLPQIFFAYDLGITKPDGLSDVLKSLTRIDEKDDSGPVADLQGLFYFGTLPDLPDENMIPQFLKDTWGFITDNIKIQGCVYRSGLIPNLMMQVPILNPPKKFEGDVINTVELSLAFSSPLMTIQQALPPKVEEATANRLLGYSKDAGDAESVLRQNREIALNGALIFANNDEIELGGRWPLDEDTLVFTIKSKLANLQSYFAGSRITDYISIPTDIAIGIALNVSKSRKQLESLEFDLAVAKWEWKSDIVEIVDLNVHCTIMNPGRVNYVTANFGATAQLGGDKGVRLLCNGSYPNGEYNLYLDPETPIAISDLVQVFDPGTGISNDADGNKTFITKLSGKYDSDSEYFAFEMAVNKGASLKADTTDQLKFILDELNVGIYGKRGDKFSFKLDAQFSYKLDEDDTLIFNGVAEYNDGWRFSVAYDGNNASLKKIATSFGLSNVPNKLDKFYFRNLSFTFDSALGLKYFGGKFEVMLYGKRVLLQLEVQKLRDVTYFLGDFTTSVQGKAVNFKIDFLTAGSEQQLALQMEFNIAGVDIFLQASHDKSGEEGEIEKKKFSGGTKGLNLRLTDLLKAVLKTVEFNLPNGFLPDIILQDIYISYDGETNQTSLIALTAFEDHTVRFFMQYGAENTETEEPSFYVFGIDSDVADFSQLPLVGEQMQDVSLAQVGFIYTSAEMEYCLPQLIENEDGGVNTIELADEISCSKGLTIGGNINLPNEEAPIPLTLPVSADRRFEEVMVLGADGIYALAVVANENSAPPLVKWINVNKKMGPVAVSKLGFSFTSGTGGEDSRLSLLISGALMLADLTLNVEGLGLSFSLPALIRGDNVGAKFELDGLGLALKKEPLELSGMLLRTQPVGDELVSFYGAAQISTSGFSIKGIGAYAKTRSAGDSLFVYGLYNGPIGGPSFFFVTGIAAGFGYNRTVRIPKLEEVKDFPLVAMALSAENKSITEILSDLIKYNWIPTSAGDYWLALGIKFTSFNIVESFVLVTVNFGGKLEFAVIGLSLLKWPNNGPAIVYIELAVLARFGPDSDVIAITGMLTPNSYIFNKNCKLTGGFAFYSWVSGEHEGDFVISLGGYHPLFKKPDHYPAVDRLALNWKFSDELSLSGEMYFALTPNYLMAGGKWEIAYNLSFLSARVTIWADMFIKWAPFQYDIIAGIIVRIEANIKIAFIHIHFKLQLACVVHIWGPDFAGEIYVDWTIFSFTIPFGAGEKKVLPALKWEKLPSTSNETQPDGFKESFVPLKGGKEMVLDARIVKGVANEAPAEDKKAANSNAEEITFINSYNLVIALDSFFPLQEIYTCDTVKLADGSLSASGEKQLPATTLMEIAGEDIPKTIDDRAKEFGVKPMKVDLLNVKLHAWLMKDNVPRVDNIAIIANAKGVNSALWGKPDLGADGEPSIIKNALSGIQMHTIETIAEKTEPFRLGRLEKLKTVVLTLGKTRAAEPGCRDGVAGKISTALNAPLSDKLFNDLKSLGFPDLIKPEPVSYDKILNTTPQFFIPIGERLPSKPML